MALNWKQWNTIKACHPKKNSVEERRQRVERGTMTTTRHIACAANRCRE